MQEKAGRNRLFDLLRILKLATESGMYERKIYRIGKYLLIEEHIDGRYGAPGVSRAAKRKRTPEEVERQNRDNRERKVWRLILRNFKAGDYHLILTYRKEERPETFEEGTRCLREFLGKMRKEYKRAGIPFKWIAVTEQGEKGALHHHLIVENRDYIATKMVQNQMTGKVEARPCGTDMLVRLLWTRGRPQFSMLDDGDYRQLAAYITKAKTKQKPDGRHNRVCYSRSRNLIVPQPERRHMLRRLIPGRPGIRKGYELLKGSLEYGISDLTGLPWQRYVLVKINPKRD